MSVSGLCAICQSAPATASCPQCGRVVCGEHFERSEGICVECASGLTQT